MASSEILYGAPIQYLLCRQVYCLQNSFYMASYCTVDSHSTLYNVRATANNWQSISSGYYGRKSLKAVTCEMPLAYEGFQ